MRNYKLGFNGETLGAPRAQFRRLNSRKSASCGHCSFSPDLTADEIPATGGHRRFVVTIQLSLNGTNESVILIPLSFEASISCNMAFSQAKMLILRP
ncbi:MAG: hypothetical protein IKP72_05385, partial [Clostridia bacterium]|nr:hypothetical protein [Clostridia bacterium]